MQIKRQKPQLFRTGKKSGIWLALFCALALHLLFLFLPLTPRSPGLADQPAAIELQFTRVTKQPEAEAIPVLAEPEPQVVSETGAQAPVNERQSRPEPQPAMPSETPPATNFARQEPQRNLDSMSEAETRVLTSTILARQYITEESVTDQLFGKPIEQHSGELQKEFHYPLRPDLLSMLDKPLPDVPFDYTPGLIYFAYDPGVKGDLQRFWDVITPEFGWRTKYGTEVRCVLVLVLIGCGWK